MYYSTVASDLFNNNLDIVVARSTNGGKTWGTPVPVYRPTAEFLYIGDKDAIAAGPDPTVKTRDNLYVAWNDSSANLNTGESFTGLPVAHSTDGGATWQVAYADKVDLSMAGCSLQEYTGATPIVDRKTAPCTWSPRRSPGRPRLHGHGDAAAVGVDSGLPMAAKRSGRA